MKDETILRLVEQEWKVYAYEGEDEPSDLRYLGTVRRLKSGYAAHGPQGTSQFQDLPDAALWLGEQE